MALAIDGASPVLAISSSSDSITAASFTRPASGLLVAMVMGASDTTFTVSGGSLTWTRRVQRVVSGVPRSEIWTAPVTGSGAMTVTAAGTGGYNAIAVKVDAVTGQDASPIGNSGNNVATSNTLSVTGYTSSAAGSRGFFAAIEANGLGSPTVANSDNGFPWDNTSLNVSGIAIRKASNTVSSSTTVTFGADAPGSSTASWAWCALEIKPISSIDASITVTTVAVAATVPDLAVSVGAGRTPDTVTPAVSVPDLAVQAGSNIVVGTVTPTVDVPDLFVSTETIINADLPPVAPTVDVPDLTVRVDAGAALGAITPTVSVPDLVVRVDANVILGPVIPIVSVPAPIADRPVLPGDKVVRAGQIEWNGFLLGSGTPYSWQDLQGWVASAPWISGNVDRPDSSGSYPGQPYTAERAINWGMMIRAPRDQIGQVVDDLVLATGPAQSEEEGYLVIWDWGDIRPRLVRAHLSNRDPGPINRQARVGLMRGALQWTASDPRRYDPVRLSLTIAKGVETSILNAGNDATPGEMRFPGPAGGIQVENITTNRVLAFSTTVGSGETLIVDVKEDTAAIGDTPHKNDLIEGSTSIQDFVFAPGPNRLLYTTASGGSGGMQTFWRHAVS